MDVLEKIEIIRKKFKNGDYNFTKEDMYLINKEQSLIELFIEVAKADNEIWNYPIVDKFKLKLINNPITAYKVCLKEIDNGNINVFGSISRELDVLSDSQIKSLKDYLFSKIKDDSYKIEKLQIPSEYVKDLVQLFIDTERYDDISKIALNYYDVDLECLDIFMKPFLEGIVYKLPIFSMKQCDFQFYEILDKYDFNTMPLQLLKAFTSVNSDIYDYDLFYNKIKNNPKEFYYFNNVYVVGKVLEYSSKKQQKELLDLFLENDYIEPFFIPGISYDFNDEVIDKICSSIRKRGNTIQQNLFIDCLNSLTKNEKIISTFIDCCNFSAAFNGCDDYEEIDRILKKYENKIIKVVSNYSGKISSDSLDLENLLDYPEIIKAFIKQDPTLDSLSYILDEEIYENNEDIRNMINNILLNNDDVKYVPECKSAVMFLLKNKKYDLFRNLDLSSYVEDSDFREVLYDALKDGNIYFIDCVLEYNDVYILKYDKFLNLFLYNKWFDDSVVTSIIENEMHDYYTEEVYSFYKEKIADLYGIDIVNLDKIKNVVGLSVFKYILGSNSFLQDYNTEKLLTMNDFLLDKVLGLFPDTEFTINDAEAIYDALKQYEFGKIYPDVINIFSLINHALDDEQYDVVENLLFKLSSVMDDRFFKVFSKEYKVISEVFKGDSNALIAFLQVKLESSDYNERDKYKNVLHFITDYYIATQREFYRDHCDMGKELHLPYKLLPKDVKNVFAKVALAFNIEVGDSKTGIIDCLTSALKDKNMDEDIINGCITYYLKKEFSKENEVEIKRNMYLVIKELKRIINDNFSYEFQEDFVKRYVDNDELKRKYYIDENNNGEDIIEKLDLDFICEKLFDDDDAYKSLVEIVNKYKLHRLPSCFSSLLNSANLDFNWSDSSFANYINAYSMIYKQEKSRCTDKEDVGIPDIVSVFVNSSSEFGELDIYKKILGEENYYLIKSNPGPNCSLDNFLSRIDKTMKYVKSSYKRLSVTVPTFNQEFTIDNGKSMRVLVGNFTDSCNLTHGERTGSCMRIGGVGHSLYDFCLNNPNGFHMTFFDNEDNSYISRVSGFRNGNTVFFNQLRYSCNSKYDNQDLIDVLFQASKYLIELSKNDESAIDNVVISPYYALEDTDYPMKNLGVCNIKEGLPSFYSDVDEFAIVLASSRKDNKLVEVNLDNNNLPSYLPSRNLIREGKDLRKDIEKVYYTKNFLEEENLYNLNPLKFDSDIVYTICNDDWYICIDDNNKIYGDLINIDPRAKLEFSKCYMDIIDRLGSANYDNKQLIKKHLVEE